MKKFPVNKKEKDRLAALQNYSILDTEYESNFDDLVELASFICQTQMSFISLIDVNRQWFKAVRGFDAVETPREFSFCQYTIMDKELMEVPDSLQDERFRNNPYVIDTPNIRFYAGVPLLTPEGHAIGSLCVVDSSPKTLTPEQKKMLKTIGDQVMAQFDLKRRNEKLSQEVKKLLQERMRETKRELRDKKIEINHLQEAINLSNATIEFTTEGEILNANKKFLQITGYTKKEIEGKHHSFFIDEKDKNSSVYLDFWDDLKKGVFKSGRFKRVSKKGKIIWLRATYNPIRDNKQNVVKILKIAHDITKEKEAEEKLALAKEIAEQAVIAKDNFLTNMSHEIRTPMNAIIGFTDILRKTELTKEQKEYLDHIRNAEESLLYLINDILDLSKIEAGMLRFEEKRFSPAEVIDKVKNMFRAKAKEKNLKFISSVASDTPYMVLGDPHRLTQILINLIGNAIKFTDKGSITVEMKSGVTTNSKIELLFAVRDTGIGITDDKQKMIFNRFTQASASTARKYGGTGLGLNISKSLVELQEGKLTFHSKKGEGTEFIFSIPYKKDSKSVKNTFQITEIPILERNNKEIRILVCEDNIMNQKLIKILLDQLGVMYEIAENGNKGIELLGKNTFDLILMDLQMPEKDGYEMTEYIRKELRFNIPIIALTAHSTIREKDRCFALGMNDYISKPFRQEDLYESIIRLLNKQGQMGVVADLKYLREMSGGNAAFEKEVIEIFFDQSKKMIENIEEAILKKDISAISNIAHKMKSSLFVISAENLISLFEQLERTLTEKKVDFNFIKKIKKKIDVEMNKCYQFLENALQEL